MLRQRGVGVQPFTTEFLRIEDKVRQGDQASVIKGLEALSERLTESEERYQQAQAVAQPRTGSYASAGSASAGMEERLRQELGDLAPAVGAKLQRRYRIARRILDLQSEGRIVDQYRRLYREVEELAARGDSNALRLRLTVAEHQLGLPSLDQED
jgi:hypothetical protein